MGLLLQDLSPNGSFGYTHVPRELYQVAWHDGQKDQIVGGQLLCSGKLS